MNIITKHYCKKCNEGIEKNKEWKKMHDYYELDKEYCLDCIVNMPNRKRKYE